MTEGIFGTLTICPNEETEKTVVGIMTKTTLLKTSNSSLGSLIRYKPKYPSTSHKNQIKNQATSGHGLRYQTVVSKAEKDRRASAGAAFEFLLLHHTHHRGQISQILDRMGIANNFADNVAYIEVPGS